MQGRRLFDKNGWIKLNDKASLYPEVIGLTSCLTSVYQESIEVEVNDVVETSRILDREPWGDMDLSSSIF